MAKRRRTVTRSHAPSAGNFRPGFSRGSSGPGGRGTLAPPSARRNNNTLLLISAAVAAVVVIGGLLYLYGNAGSPGASPSPSPVAVHTPTTTINAAAMHAPSATPLASPPTSPGGDGTTATIQTDLGTITFQVYNQSAPVASQNFINLADAGFYNGLTFHRIVPGFVIQGGDPAGNGSGGPGYTIPDEPVVGNYTRGIVAMARTTDPNSAGSQFFIVLDDSVAQSLPKSGGYVIFGKVTSGLDVVDQIAATPNSGSPNNAALDPVYMNLVTIQPGAPVSPPPATGSPTATGSPPPTSGTSAPASGSAAPATASPTPNPSAV